MKIRLGAALSGVCSMGAAVLLGSALMTASTTPAAAQAATSCNGGNVSVFNRTAPAGGAANVNQAGTFFVGDVITATATGLILSVAFDVNPGSNLLLFLNNTTGSGSFTFPSSGTFTIAGAVNAQAGGSGSVAFTCVSGPGAGAAAGAADGAALTPENTGAVVDGVSNTQQTVEDTAVNGLVDGGAHQDPSTGLSSAQQKIADLEKVREDLLERRRKQKTEVDATRHHFQVYVEATNPGVSDIQYESAIKDGDSDAEKDRKGAENLYHVFRGLDGKDDDGSGYDRHVADIRAAEARLAEIDAEIADLESRIDEAWVQSGGEPVYDALELKPFAASAQLDRFEREFMDIVRHFDEPENNTFQPLEFNRTLDRKTVAWVRASYTEFDQDDATRQEGDTTAIALGIHRDFWEDIRLGVFATTTWSDLESPVNTLDVDTRGYSAGLYGRYIVEGLSLSARARYGWSDSDISVGGATGSYDTSVFNVSVAASGREDMNPFIWVQHTTSLSSSWASRDSYTTSAGANIGSNDTWSGQASLGPTFGTTIENTGSIVLLEPALGFSASYVFSNRDSQSGTVATSDDDYFSGAVSPELSMVFDNGASLDLQTSYFGIGASLRGWSVGGTFSLPLN